MFLQPDTRSHTFTHIHLGPYYLCSYNDVNGDRRHLSGDFMCSKVDNAFNLAPEGRARVQTSIDFVIP